MQDVVEFQERFFVEANAIQVLRPDSRVVETIGDGMVRKSGVVFLAGESFFLGGCDDLAVNDQRRGGIVIECRDSQDRRLFHLAT